MTEYELAEYLSILLGFSPDEGSVELSEQDATHLGDLIDQNLPQEIDANMFTQEILGFSTYADVTGSSAE